MSRLYVIIATIGRPEVVRRTIDWLERQTRPADGIIISTVSPADVAGLNGDNGRIEIVYGDKGLPRQRNTGLRALNDRADIVAFFDDDFVPAIDYLENVEAAFASDASLVGATGRLIADGIGGDGYDFDEALALVEADQAPALKRESAAQALYGCNMIVRISATQGLLFDETLPLYGWLEDVDFTSQLARRGRLVRSEHYAGVHMGTKGGRTSGLRLGYSQIANPVYLSRKNTVPSSLALRLISQNLAANILGSIGRDPKIDRRGRLKGNFLAIADVVLGRVDPRKITAL